MIDRILEIVAQLRGARRRCHALAQNHLFLEVLAKFLNISATVAWFGRSEAQGALILLHCLLFLPCGFFVSIGMGSVCRHGPVGEASPGKTESTGIGRRSERGEEFRL